MGREARLRVIRWARVGGPILAGLLAFLFAAPGLVGSPLPVDAAMPPPQATVFVTPITPPALPALRLPAGAIPPLPGERLVPRPSPTAVTVIPPGPRTAPLTPTKASSSRNLAPPTPTPAWPGPGPVYGFPPIPAAPNTQPVTPAASAPLPARADSRTQPAAPAGPARSTGPTPLAGDVVGRSLLVEANRRQTLRLDRTTPLLRHILADGFAPTSAEFGMMLPDGAVVAQRADDLDGDVVRVYYRALSGPEGVWFVQRPSARPLVEESLVSVREWQTEDRLLAEATRQRVVHPGPTRGLTRAMAADQFVPTSSEFSQRVGSVLYVAQRAEHRDTGEVRVYFIRQDAASQVLSYAQP